MTGVDAVVVEAETLEEYRTEVCSSIGRPDGKVGAYVVISVEHGYENLDGSP